MASIDTAGTRRWEELVVTQLGAIVRICLLFIKLFASDCTQITAGQCFQGTFSVHSFPCSLFGGLEALLYFTSFKLPSVKQWS